jgi:hypothetical protein
LIKYSTKKYYLVGIINYIASMNGQAIKQDFYVLRPAVTDKPVVQEAYNPGCQFYLPALAEYEPTDDHFNDKHSVIWFFDELFSDVKIYLQKLDGDWEDVAELNNTTYGIFYQFGFFVNKFSESAIGYLIEWTKVLNEEGPGVYRVRVTGTKAIGDFNDQYSFEFDLKTYNHFRADNTVRVEWNRSGCLGNRIADEKVDDYGILDWYNQIRIPKSIFGFDTSELTQEYVRYPNGSNVWLGDTQVEELIWNIYELPQYIHRFIQVDVMQAGKQKFTDYNKLAPVPTVDREVVPTSGYKPEWVVGTVNANVTVTFKPYFENLTHKRE